MHSDYSSYADPSETNMGPGLSNFGLDDSDEDSDKDFKGLDDEDGVDLDDDEKDDNEDDEDDDY